MAYQHVSAASDNTAEDMVREHYELVRRIAYHLLARLPAHTEVDDLIQSGMIGLLEAAKNYDASKGASFTTFAGIRIRGAMIDEVRRHDWTPRSVHQKHRKVMQTIADIERETGENAEGSDVVKRLNISMDDYHAILRDSAACKLFSLDEAFDDTTQSRRALTDKNPEPDENISRAQIREEVVAALDKLPEREQMVLSLYYEQELNLKEIGAVLGVSESRVCQIHGQALMRLRTRMAR